MEIKTFDKGPSHLREVLVDGQVAGWLTVIDYRMRIGAPAVKMGAIAYVNTKPKYRMKGHMRALMEDTVQYMKDRRYVVSVVSGIPDFYCKFGYVSCIPDYELSVFTRNAEQAGKATPKRRKYRTRKFRAGDVGKLLAIYNDNTAGATCTLIRTPEYFAGFPRARQEILIVEDARGRVAAYAVHSKSPDRAYVHELAARGEDDLPALAGALAALAIKRRLGRITLSLAPGHPFGEFCQRQGCRWSTTYHRNASAMMRIIDQERLLKVLAPDFGRRLRASAFHSFSGTLRFKTDMAATTLRIAKGSVSVVPDRAGAAVRLSQGQLAQLVAGYRTARDLLSEVGRGLSAKVESVLGVLFPKQNAFIWDRSRFEQASLHPEDVPA